MFQCRDCGAGSWVGILRFLAISYFSLSLLLLFTVDIYAMSCSDIIAIRYRAIDSAQWYHNEKAVGSSIIKFLSANPSIQRKDIWFTTKLQTNSCYDDTKMAIEASIRKSGLGYIDLYLLHSPYGGKEARWECWRAIEDAIEERTVKSGGVSNFGIKHVCSPPFNTA